MTFDQPTFRGTVVMPGSIGEQMTTDRAVVHHQPSAKAIAAEVETCAWFPDAPEATCAEVAFAVVRDGLHLKHVAGELWAATLDRKF
jgi:hypothetical protein